MRASDDLLHHRSVSRDNGLIIAVYSFNMFIGASLGPQLVVGLRSFGFFVTCLVFASVMIAMGAIMRAAPARSGGIGSTAKT